MTAELNHDVDRFSKPSDLDVALAREAIEARLKEQGEPIDLQEVRTRIDERLANQTPSAERIEIYRRKRKEMLQQRTSYRVSRQLTLLLKDKKRLMSETFEQAGRHLGIAAEAPVGFELQLQAGDIRCSLSIEEGYTPRLDLRVATAERSEGNELFAALRQWIDGVKPTAGQRWWVKLQGLQWFVWFSWLIVTLFIEAAIASSSPYEEAAHKLLAHGLERADQLKALQILLALSSDYQPQGSAGLHLHAWFWVSLVAGLISCILLSIQPRVCIGLGKGETRVRRWRRWMSFVFFSIPSFVFLAIASFFANRLLGAMFH